MLPLFDETILKEDVPNKLEKYIISQHLTDFALLFKQNKGMVIKSCLHYDTTFEYKRILVESIF